MEGTRYRGTARTSGLLERWAEFVVGFILLDKDA